MLTFLDMQKVHNVEVRVSYKLFPPSYRHQNGFLPAVVNDHGLSGGYWHCLSIIMMTSNKPWKVVTEVIYIHNSREDSGANHSGTK